jgi:2-dehydro-3-deoxyphosphogluconate aldolase/(4S)-4-hydroxy-2-oxoglutarate aldolase
MITKLTESGVIAVIRRIPAEHIEQVADHLIAGGVTALEVTVDTPEAFRSIEKLSLRLKGQAIVGAGTVLDRESAKMAINSGAEFVFSPSLHEDVIRTALRYGKIAVPGVMSPTEMVQAMEWGADIVKLFPASVLGAKFIKDVKAPFPHVPIIPTGGINLSNVAEFIRVGVAAVGLGGSLINMEEIKEGNYKGIQSRSEQFVRAIKQAREER